MPLPIKTLPVVERWDCTGCGKCCRGNLVPLDEDDLKTLRHQQWDQHPDFRDVRTITRRGLFRKSHYLAQQEDGTCVFLSDDGLCQIHKEFGFENKPLICQMYPLQLVPAGETAYLTLRRSCPTAAADQGRPLEQHRRQAKKFARLRTGLAERIAPPKITPKCGRSWKETLVVASAIEKLMTDTHYPLIRRLVHGLRFCQLLEQCRLKKVPSKEMHEFVSLLRESATQDVGDLFRDRQEPSNVGSLLFRQTAIGYLRLHPLYQVKESWRERLRLTWAAWRFARGTDNVPKLHPDFPDSSFDSLEEPLGHLDQETQRPLNAYFETTAISRQYAIVSRPNWSVIEKFRALALAYPVALWMLRYFCGDGKATANDVIEMVTAIDRGQGHNQLTGPLHRWRVNTMAYTAQLERVAIWYAR